MTIEQNEYIKELKKAIRGDVYHDPLVLGMYATDASVYQIMPVAVVCPRDEDDVKACVRIAGEYQVPILARGGGTSLAGQTVAEAIVLDFSKYMNSILLLDDRTVTVQPGVVRHQLNKFLHPKGLEFAPDPATSSRATVGGMIANNSSGTKSILYGRTSDHVLELKVLLADGTIIRTKPLTPDELQQKLHSQSREGELYRGMIEIALPLQEEVNQRFPKTMRRVGGYAFDDFLASGCGDLNRLIIGSEGTLGIILEAQLKTVELPKFKGLSVVQFVNAREAIRATRTMVKYNPAAVEILGKLVLGYSRKNRETAAMCNFIKGDPDYIQIVEFYGDDPEEIRQRAEAMNEELRQLNFGYAHDYYPEGKTYHNVWGIRERGLGLLLGEPTDKKGMPVIEDAAIPLEHLDAYIGDVLEICQSRNVDVDFYAHASVGVIHVRPMLDMRKEEDIQHFRAIADAAFERVMHYGGSWSSEHGDGIVRSGHLKRFYGERIYDGFKRTKGLFDPHFLLNPGKIIDPPPMDSHLRYGPAYQDQPFEAVYKYREQRDFFTAVHQCSGLGACRKLSGGTMCPSFMVTLDEVDSTRGRANALRLAMSGQIENGLQNKDLPEVLDLCLSCKACKTECPSSVDMARLKGEVMQQHFDKYGVSWKDRIVGSSAGMARQIAGPLAAAVNTLQALPVVRQVMLKIMGLDMRRSMPVYALRKWTGSYRQHVGNKAPANPDIVLLADTYTQCHNPDTGMAAVRLLEALGKKVLVLNAGCCQRPRISHGLLKEAAARIKSPVQRILPWLEQGIPVGVLEPGCTSAWTDDIPDLIEDDRIAGLLKNIQPFENILLQALRDTDQGAMKIRPKTDEVIVHGHCHHKALYGMDMIRSIFSHWPEVKCHIPDSGCCGMAGSFGYEEKHYDLSKKMAERVLIPAIEDQPEAMVIANGFSCQHQIADFAGREPVHIAEAFTVV